MEQILSKVAEERSPITGDKFPPLSPEYAKHKKAEVGNRDPDLTLTGAMLDSLSFETTDDGIEIGVYGKRQAPKADGHNNFSGASTLPLRQFLPDQGQGFSESIQNEVNAMVAEYLADNIEIPKEDLAAVQTRAELYTLLEEYFIDMTRAEIKAAVVTSMDLLAELEEEDVLDLL